MCAVKFFTQKACARRIIARFHHGDFISPASLLFLLVCDDDTQESEANKTNACSGTRTGWCGPAHKPKGQIVAVDCNLRASFSRSRARSGWSCSLFFKGVFSAEEAEQKKMTSKTGRDSVTIHLFSVSLSLCRLRCIEKQPSVTSSRMYATMAPVKHSRRQK